MQSQKRILIAPLNWGLGHATRCIPIIRMLIKKNATVIIAAEGRPLELLKKEFPELSFIVFKGYPISYPHSGSMILKMLFSIPKIVKGIHKEQQTLEKIINEYKIEVVISDNRYGCYSKKVKSIFITHQLMIKSPAGESFLHKRVLNYIRNYDECWIPDLKKEHLSGDLAHKHPLPANTYFIGPQSRFENASIATGEQKKYELMGIVSGPEPQRTILKELLITQFKKSELRSIIVCGEPESESKEQTTGQLTLVSHMSSGEMQNTILQSALIVSRSGYSTIMDLHALEKKAIFIPTPGQTEQEYLAERCKQQQIAFFQSQATFDLKEAISETKKYSGFKKSETKNELEERINLLLR